MAVVAEAHGTTVLGKGGKMSLRLGKRLKEDSVPGVSGARA